MPSPPATTRSAPGLKAAFRPRWAWATAVATLAASTPGLAGATDAAAGGAARPVAAATANASAGATRATTVPASQKRYFKADLSWANNTYYTPSEASGTAEFELDVATKTLRWILSYQGLSSAPTRITLHAPAQPGATGAAILDLAPGNPKSPARGEGQLSDAQIEYLLTGWSYALVTSRKYPQGEARGQLDRVRTATPAFQ